MGFMMNGGWVMVVLLGLSVTSLAIVLQKIVLLKSTKISPNFVHSLKAKLMTDGPDEVWKKLKNSRKLVGKIAAKSIEKHASSEASLSSEITELTKKDVEELTSKMNLLSMIITTAPVLGLLGTVLGLMDVFSVIAVEGTGQAELLSAGISKALVTTVTGLSLAIPLMFIHQFIGDKIDERLDEWNTIAVQLVTFLNDRKNA